MEEACMNLSKAIRQVCVTAACVMLGTATVFAADMGQATGSNVNVREAAGTNAAVLGQISSGSEYQVTGKSWMSTRRILNISPWRKNSLNRITLIWKI